MKVLFCAAHFGCYRNFESVVRALAARGHQVHLTADERDSLGGEPLVQRLAGEVPGLTYEFMPPLDEWEWAPLARAVRRGLEYVRFLDPRYERIVKYRARTHERAPLGLVRLVRGWRDVAWTRRLTAAALAAVERGIPTNPVLDEFIARHAPDVVLLASVTNPGAPQLDYQKSAMAAGRHHALTIFSWDHLSGKAWLKLAPERMFVWNEVQKREAVELHGLPAGRIVATGAQCYDQWFDRPPSRDREAFCAELGLDPRQPILLYVCSVLSRPAPAEAPFVLDWVRALRSSRDPRLRDAGVVIRPHPERLREWSEVDLAPFANVVLRGRNPIDAHSRAEYYDSLHHAAAVVGLVTSAFVEAAVVGRPTLTVQAPEFVVHQEGTTHFSYLVDPENGVLLTAPDFAGHIEQLGRVLTNPAEARERTRRFVETFVRPHGLDVAATQVFTGAVEALAAEPGPAPAQFGGGLPRRAAERLRSLARHPRTRLWFLSAKERDFERHRAEHELEEQLIKTRAREERQAREDARRLAEERRQAELARVKAQRRAERERRKREKRQAHDERKRAVPADSSFRNR